MVCAVLGGQLLQISPDRNHRERVPLAVQLQITSRGVSLRLAGLWGRNFVPALGSRSALPNHQISVGQLRHQDRQNVLDGDAPFESLMDVQLFLENVH